MLVNMVLARADCSGNTGTADCALATRRPLACSQPKLDRRKGLLQLLLLQLLHRGNGMCS